MRLKNIKKRLKSIVAGNLIALSDTKQQIEDIDSGGSLSGGITQRTREQIFDEQFVKRHYEILEKAREFDLNRASVEQIIWFADLGEVDLPKFEYEKDADNNLVISEETELPIILGEYSDLNGKIIFERNNDENDPNNPYTSFILDDNNDPIPIGAIKTITNKLLETDKDNMTYLQKSVSTVDDAYKGVDVFAIKLNGDSGYNSALVELTDHLVTKRLTLKFRVTNISTKGIITEIYKNPELINQIQFTTFDVGNSTKDLQVEYDGEKLWGNNGVIIKYKYTENGEA